MSKIENLKKVLKKALKFDNRDHNAHKIKQAYKKYVTITFSTIFQVENKIGNNRQYFGNNFTPEHKIFKYL
jgi:hypothetical protein